MENINVVLIVTARVLKMVINNITAIFPLSKYDILLINDCDCTKYGNSKAKSKRVKYKRVNYDES